MTIGRRLEFPVTAGQTYTFTKYVDVENSNERPPTRWRPRAKAWRRRPGRVEGAARRERGGLGEALARADRSAGNPTLAREVNASQFYLWSSTSEGVDWSISPAGLSSNGYDGHIFWDAETWMYPSLLAQHPELAAGMDDYRFARLAAAQAHAQRDRLRRAPASPGRARSTAPSRSRRRCR